MVSTNSMANLWQCKYKGGVVLGHGQDKQQFKLPLGPSNMDVT